MRTSARRVAILAFDEVELLDIAGVVQPLTVAGRHWNWRPFAITAVGRAPGLVETRNQIRFEATAGLGTEHDTEILVVPGGYGARKARDDSAWIEFVKLHGARASRVCSVGAGVLLLAECGFIDGETVAVSHELLESIARRTPSAHPTTDLEVADSGKVLTAAASGGATELGLALVAKELGDKLAVRVADELGLGWTAGADARERLEVKIVDPIP